MMPETELFLKKSATLLSEAKTILSVGLVESAGRAAYLCAFHAAQALILEKTKKIAKTHRGVRAEFNRLIKDTPLNGDNLTYFLAESYNLKEIADYETGDSSDILPERVEQAIQRAKEFHETVRRYLEAELTS
ncbi:MAG: HEPN domain-containing protein [Holosporales bacterium]|jgi:uncharacterized protein (UPF0332 family)